MEQKKKLSASTPDIGGNYTKAKVNNSDPRTIWILYDGKNYSSPNFSQHEGAKIIHVSDNEVDYGMTIKSARGFNAYEPGIILFEDFYFRGKTAGPFQDSHPNVTDILTSSLIVTGGIWKCFSGTDYGGAMLGTGGDYKFGKGAYTLKGPPNDKTRSVKLVRVPGTEAETDFTPEEVDVSY